MFHNPYIGVPLLAWALAQIAKFTLKSIRGKVDWHVLYSPGGMPSAHTATVTSLATTAYLEAGAESPIFGICAVLAAIVSYDSLGVRRSTGQQTTVINAILEHLNKKAKRNFGELTLKRFPGHRPVEVGVGALIGIVTTVIINLL